MLKCIYCGSSHNVDPYSRVCELCILKSKAYAYDKERTHKFISNVLAESGLDEDDRRIDYSSEEAFRRSVAEARLADKGEQVYAASQELAAKEEMLRAREAQYGSPGGGTASKVSSEVKALQEELASLKGKGWLKRVAEIKSRLRQLGVEG